MKIKQIIDEDFVNYKKSSMVIGFPYCSFKCDIDCGRQVCHNSILATTKIIEIDTNDIIKRYMSNDLTSAICCIGLEPIDSWMELLDFIQQIRRVSNDDIVIYTGYNEDEIKDKVQILKQYRNIIIKFGRYIPDQQSHYDDVLGVYLASDNQYAKKVS